MKKKWTQHLYAFIAAVSAITQASASPIWHCSRTISTESTANAEQIAQQDQFSIASFNSSSEAISVSVRDLIDIYTGNPVRVGGLQLSACFLINNQSLTYEALTSLGIQLKTIEALARRNSIAQNNLFYVTDEVQMNTCIAKNFPAVGYLPHPIDTAKILPCF